jgi:hypothetical protein
LEVVITREADVSDRARALGARARAAPATGAGRAPMAIDEADMPAGRPVRGSTRASESGSGGKVVGGISIARQTKQQEKSAILLLYGENNSRFRIKSIHFGGHRVV